MFITVVVLLAVSVLTSLVTVMAHNRLTNRLKQYEAAFVRYFTTQKEGEASEFGATIQSISEVFANELYIKVKAGMMGNASVQARDIKAVEGAIALDSVGELSPVIEGVLEASPRLKKLVEKRPQLLALAQQMFAGSGKLSRGNGSSYNDIKRKYG